MSENNPDISGNGGSGNGAGDGDHQFALEKIYVKDMSFEVPDAPAVFNEDQADTQINMNLKNSHREIDEGVFEVVLHVSLHATIEERSMFLIEIDQAGLFSIRGYAADAMRQLVSTTCPAALYPYLREAISATIGRGGFSSILLQPINFDALFAQAEMERARPQA
ncbi:MAG: protein-export chaperone SecB [Gammaproteobacteria bacterium]